MTLAEKFVRELRLRGSGLSPRILFPDALDVRTLRAVETLNVALGIPSVLVGHETEIRTLAASEGVSLENVEIRDPCAENNKRVLDNFAEIFYSARKEKGIAFDEARSTVAKPLYYVGMLVRSGDADAVVAGSLSFTGDVVRAGIQTIGLAEGISVVSSYFLIIFPEKIFCFADSGVVPEPNAVQLADIAIAAANNFHRVTGQQPRVAMLSFSTHGSAEHHSVAKVREATALVKKKDPTLIVDGELQLDAAIVPEVMRRKAPDSVVQGDANVLIFPDLNAGNIGYKIAERLGGAQAIGPIIQGLAKPYLDLSRGCTVDDIINTACIAAIMAKG